MCPGEALALREHRSPWHWPHGGRQDRGASVDLTGVAFIDHAGRYLLQLMHRDGVRLVGSGLMLQDILDHIRGSTAEGAHPLASCSWPAVFVARHCDPSRVASPAIFALSQAPLARVRRLFYLWTDQEGRSCARTPSPSLHAAAVAAGFLRMWVHDDGMAGDGRSECREEIPPQRQTHDTSTRRHGGAVSWRRT
jgi:hypothetical protein